MNKKTLDLPIKDINKEFFLNKSSKNLAENAEKSFENYRNKRDLMFDEKKKRRDLYNRELFTDKNNEYNPFYDNSYLHNNETMNYRDINEEKHQKFEEKDQKFEEKQEIVEIRDKNTKEIIEKHEENSKSLDFLKEKRQEKGNIVYKPFFEEANDHKIFEKIKQDYQSFVRNEGKYKKSNENHQKFNENQVKINENQDKNNENQRKFNENQRKFNENQRKFNENNENQRNPNENESFVQKNESFLRKNESFLQKKDASIEKTEDFSKKYHSSEPKNYENQRKFDAKQAYAQELSEMVDFSSYFSFFLIRILRSKKKTIEKPSKKKKTKYFQKDYSEKILKIVLLAGFFQYIFFMFFIKIELEVGLLIRIIMGIYC